MRDRIFYLRRNWQSFSNPHPRITSIKKRELWDCLIFIMGIPGKTVFILKQVPDFWNGAMVLLNTSTSPCHEDISALTRKFIPSSEVIIFRADSGFAPSQWEMVSLCNNISHWLDASLESALKLILQYLQVSGMYLSIDCHSELKFNWKFAVISFNLENKIATEALRMSYRLLGARQ